MKKKIILVLLALTLIFVTFLKPITTAAKVVLFITEEFPQLQYKPLQLITGNPKMEKINFTYDQKKVGADLFLPQSGGRHPAIIVVMGVRTQEKDKPIITHFADTLARLGYVVFWPMLEDLDKGLVKFDDPLTFVESFGFLEKRTEVDPERINFVGFSVGSSTAMVASEDEKINKKLRSLVWFGGYLNIFDYFSSLEGKSIVVDGQKVFWDAHPDAIDYASDALEMHNLTLEGVLKGELQESTKSALLKFSPDQNLDKFKAKIFILHEKSDTFVPYVESVKLKQALEGKVPVEYYISSLFEHVQPKKGVSPEILKEFLGLYWFLYQVFIYL